MTSDDEEAKRDPDESAVEPSDVLPDDDRGCRGSTRVPGAIDDASIAR
jgi:hypothetical protein